MAAVMSGDEVAIPTSVAALDAGGLRETGVPAKWKEQLVRLKLTDKSGAVEFLKCFEWTAKQADTRRLKTLRRWWRGVGSQSRAENAEQELTSHSFAGVARLGPSTEERSSTGRDPTGVMTVFPVVASGIARLRNRRRIAGYARRVDLLGTPEEACGKSSHPRKSAREHNCFTTSLLLSNNWWE
jgi:hypothetical protein